MARKIKKIQFDPEKGLDEVKVQFAGDNGDKIEVTTNLSVDNAQDGLQVQLLTKIFEKEVEAIKNAHIQPLDTTYPKDEYVAEDFPELRGILKKHGFKVIGVKNYNRPHTALIAKNVTVIIGLHDFVFEKSIDISFMKSYVEQMFGNFGPEHIAVDDEILTMSPMELSYGLISVWNVAPEFKNIIEIDEYKIKEDHYSKNVEVTVKASVKDALKSNVNSKTSKTIKFFSEGFAFSDVELAIEQIAPITSIRSLTEAPQNDTSKFMLDTSPFTSAGFTVGKPASINPNSPGSFDKDEKEVMINLPVSIYDYETEIEIIAVFERSYYEDLLKNFNPIDARLLNLGKFISTDDPDFTEEMLAGNLETDKEVELKIARGSLVKDQIDKRKFGITVELTAGTYNSLLDVEGNLGLGINPPKELVAQFTEFTADVPERIGGAQLAETLHASGITERSVSSLQLDTREIEIKEQ